MSQPRGTHTPEEWIVEEQNEDDEIRVILNDAGPGVAVIAVIEDQLEAVANAHLIAAAPDLYEACKLALAEMCNTVAPRTSFTDAVDLLDAAITKAEGHS